MKKYIIKGGNRLSGEVAVSGSKNVVLKAIIAACLTEEVVEIKNVPLISDLFVMLELVREIGGRVQISGRHTIRIEVKKIKNVRIPLEAGAKIRTSSMFVAPLLARNHEALIPNPGGCRIGARPIDRHIEGLMCIGATSVYDSKTGNFHLKTRGLSGAKYKFTKNTHTGTETMIMAAVLARGRTVLENAAEEPEVDDLISLLNSMGAQIVRSKRTIVIDGVGRLHGTSYTIMPDRNEVVTFAILSALTGGKIYIRNVQKENIAGFLSIFKKAGGKWEIQDSRVRFYIEGEIKPTDIVTSPHPGFMTDWQGPWAIFMTQAKGESTIHETVYESRFGYVDELSKMGANLELYSPKVKNPKIFYNFDYSSNNKDNRQALRIVGKTSLHNAVLNISDLRAGATIAIGSLIATGESIIYGAEILERGYEAFDRRLEALGANIKVTSEDVPEI